MVVTDTVSLGDGFIARSHRFRTMGADAAVFQGFARWMRRTRIDELPALWSIVRGDITLRDAWVRRWRRSLR